MIWHSHLENRKYLVPNKNAHRPHPSPRPFKVETFNSNLLSHAHKRMYEFPKKQTKKTENSGFEWMIIC